MSVSTEATETICFPRADEEFLYRLEVVGGGKVRAETLEAVAIAVAQPTGARIIRGSAAGVRAKMRDRFPLAREHKGVTAALPPSAPTRMRRHVWSDLPRRDPSEDVPAAIRALPHFGTFTMAGGVMTRTAKGKALDTRRRQRAEAGR